MAPFSYNDRIKSGGRFSREETDSSGTDFYLVIFLVDIFMTGVSPYFFWWNESFLLIGTQFADDFFLGTSLMHFLADANSTFIDLTTKTYPFAFMFASVGYLLTMLGDCVIVKLTQGARKPNRVDAEGERSARELGGDGPYLPPLAPAPDRDRICSPATNYGVSRFD